MVGGSGEKLGGWGDSWRRAWVGKDYKEWDRQQVGAQDSSARSRGRVYWGRKEESVERGKSWQRSRGSPRQEREKGPGEMQRVVSCGKQRKPQKESLGRNT